MAKGGLTARRTGQAGAKAEHSEPTVRIRCDRRLTDKSYSGDNRLVSPKSPNRRRSSAPRCRLISSRGWRRSQRYGCSPFKEVRELGSNRSAAAKSAIERFESTRNTNRHHSRRSPLEIGEYKVDYIGEIHSIGNPSHVRIIPREVTHEILNSR